MAEPAASASARRQDLLSGLLLGALAGVVLWIASDFPALPEGHPGPALFPRLIAGGLLVSGIVLVVRALKQGPSPPRSEALPVRRFRRVLRLTTTVALVALYPWLAGTLGFVAGIAVISFAVALILGARPVPAAATTVGASLAIYWLFTAFLGVPL